MRIQDGRKKTAERSGFVCGEGKEPWWQKEKADIVLQAFFFNH